MKQTPRPGLKNRPPSSSSICKSGVRPAPGIFRRFPSRNSIRDWGCCWKGFSNLKFPDFAARGRTKLIPWPKPVTATETDRFLKGPPTTLKPPVSPQRKWKFRTQKPQGTPPLPHPGSNVFGFPQGDKRWHPKSKPKSLAPLFKADGSPEGGALWPPEAVNNRPHNHSWRYGGSEPLMPVH